MTIGWRRMKLGDFVTLQRGHDLPEQQRRPGRVPILGSFGVTGYHDTPRTKGPGVTVGRSGASFGVVCYSPIDFWPLNTALYVTDFHSNDEHFAYYFLKTIDFKRYNSGSAQPSLNRNYVHPIPVEVPPLREQKTIAHILGTLDDKIELNWRMNETLEATARAIFKSWFVNFDPVRAKMNGQKPNGMDEDTAALFPSGFEDSEVGKIPTGWRSSRFGDEIAFQGGFAFKSKDWQESGVPVVKIGSVKPGIIDLNQVSYVSQEIAEQCSRYRLKVGDLLIGMTGYVGEVGLVPATPVLPLLNQRVGKFILPAEGTTSLGFWYCTTRQGEFRSFVEGRAHGTAQANVSAIGIMDYRLVVPPDNLMCAFNSLCKPMFGQILANHAQMRCLATTRDTLLPKLLSGEIRVGEAEKVAEESGE